MLNYWNLTKMNEVFETEAVVKLVTIMAYQTLVQIMNFLTFFFFFTKKCKSYRIVKFKDTVEIS